MQDGWTALMIAAHNGHEVCVRQLAEAGASIEAATKVRGWCGAGRSGEGQGGRHEAEGDSTC